MKKINLVLISIFIWTFQIFSQWNPDNTVLAHWTTTSFDEAKFVKVSGGSVYVTGNSADNSTNFAIMTIKYDASLNTVHWQSIYTSPISQAFPVSVSGIEIDKFGNVYIAGTQSNGSNNDYLVVKYDANGTQQWAVTYDNSGEDQANGITLDKNGNVYVTGGSWDNLVSGLPNIHTTTISYSPSGGAPRWVRRYWSGFVDPSNPGAHGWYSEGFAITADNATGGGHHQGVYVAGWVDNGLNCGFDCLMDASIVYYDFDGNNMSAGWYGCGGPHPEDRPGDDFAKAIVVSAGTGDIYTTGGKWCGENCSIFPNCPAEYNHFSNYEIFTARFSWNQPGHIGSLWVDHDYCDNARYEGQMPGGEDIGTSLVVDGAPGNDYVYATGSTQQDFAGDVPDYERDYITLKYNHYVEDERVQGIKLWCTDCHPDPDPELTCPIVSCPQIYNSGSTANDIAKSIGIDANGSNVFVTGTAGFPTQHIVTIQYNSSGGQVCIAEHFDVNTASGNSIAVDGGNPASIYVAGVTKNLSTYMYDFVVIKYTANNCSGDMRTPNSENEELKGIPEYFSLNQNYPNPFNPATSIKFSIPKAGFVTLKIYNSLGIEVMSVLEKDLRPGNYTENIDMSGIASGIYFYTLSAGDFRDTKKMLLIK